MGDTGSLALGGALGTIAVATKHEIVLAIIGGLFVLEAVSVIVQVTSFKLTGKRVFKMAPIHHHFEHLGWTESQVRDPLLDHLLRAGADRPEQLLSCTKCPPCWALGAMFIPPTVSFRQAGISGCGATRHPPRRDSSLAPE